jgi:hypothetical protein
MYYVRVLSITQTYGPHQKIRLDREARVDYCDVAVQQWLPRRQSDEVPRVWALP